MFRDPAEVVRDLAAPRGSLALLAEYEIDGELRSARQAVRTLAVECGADPDTAEELTVAVDEALSNALVHGQFPINLRVYGDRSVLVCEVSDAGRVAPHPLAGYVPRARQPERGMGLWLTRELCDQVELLESDATTVVRLTKRIA